MSRERRCVTLDAALHAHQNQPQIALPFASANGRICGEIAIENFPKSPAMASKIPDLRPTQGQNPGKTLDIAALSAERVWSSVMDTSWI
jgi:hypothetical protein